jgi:hypothetical protein
LPDFPTVGRRFLGLMEAGSPIIYKKMNHFRILMAMAQALLFSLSKNNGR